MVNSEEGLPVAADNPSNCFAVRAECQFAAGDIRNSEQGNTYIHTLVHTHTCTYTNTYIDTYIHVHIHIYMS